MSVRSQITPLSSVGYFDKEYYVGAWLFMDDSELKRMCTLENTEIFGKFNLHELIFALGRNEELPYDEQNDAAVKKYCISCFLGK